MPILPEVTCILFYTISYCYCEKNGRLCRSILLRILQTMIDSRWFWEGKKVTVMGLGLLGRGVGDVAYIASQGAEEVVVTDMKSAAQLKESVEALAEVQEKYKNLRFVLGGHREEDFVDCDMVLQAAGVPKENVYTGIAKEHGIPVYMSTALAAKWCMEQGAHIVGVTGTRGKTTVSHLIYSALKARATRKLPSEKSSGRALGEPSTRHFLQELSGGATEGSGNIFLGGNIRGVSTLQLLNEIAPGDTLVMELDSWQLQGFGDLTISPHVAVFTNLMPDHLNYYTTMEEYFDDKAQIFLWQKAGEEGSASDVLICGAGVAEKVRSYAPPVAPIVPEVVKRDLKLKGEHNQENAALAAAALRACGVSEKDVEEGLALCEPVEGRLQYVKTVHGVRIYNDNNASTAEATMVAIAAVKPEGPVTLVWGGSDKGVDMSALIRVVKQDATRVIFLPGTGSEKVLPDFPEAYLSNSMQDAVQKAIEVTPAGGVLLFSPAFASFGLFKNYYDRNDQFLAEVGKL
jgi:UDP-N-acetylmuramoylalanine--D-glutamate ligase